nr:MAG TPA: Large polyvalent protein-associated domain 3 [Caudoviricetes sp.]
MADNEALSRMRYKANKKKKNPKETGASLLQSGSSILSSASKGKNTASQATKTSNGKVAGVKQVSRNNSKSKKTTTPSSRQYQTALGGKKSLPIMASDAAKKAHENTMDTSPMGQLRRQGKRIQTSRTDNFNREENDSALPSGLASNLRNAQRKKNKTALSKADRKNLSKPEQLYLRSQKEAWESGQKLIERGYTEQGKQMQEEAHARAENIRRDSGYSGGDSGAGFITPEIKQDEYAGMSDAGRKNLRVAKSYYNYGKETGDKGLMDDAAEYGKAVRLDPASYDLERALAWEKKQKDVAPERLNTDGNGRTIYTPTEWDREQSEKWGTAVGKGLLGGFQTLLETARKATRNAIENRNDPTYQSQKYTADYIQHKANKTTDQAEKERLNQEAAKMRETSEAFKHNDPVPWYSDGMMNLKESRDATQDLVASRKTEAGKLMTQAGLSMLQMAPFLAANAIPGVGQAVSLGGMGALAAGQKAGELQMNGTGAGEALARGLVSGGIEAFTEKIPMDHLFKMVKNGGGTSFLKAVAKQTGIEAGEESASYAMNWLADKAAQDPNAKFSLKELLENAAVGAISGGVFGAGGHVIGSAIGAGRTPYNNPSPTEDTTPTPTVEGAPRPIQEPPTQESANPLIRASQAQEQMRTQAQEQAQANQDTREQMQSARERLLQARQALAQREAAWQERAANATEEEVPDLLREQENLLQAERRIQAQEAQAEREDAGQLSRNFGEEAAHIDQRTAGDVSKPSVKAFQWDYPQMHQYYAQAAEALLQDVEYSKAGQFSEKGRGTVVTKSEAMMQAERMGISRADLEKALIAIINDQGQENYATAKKVELVLDEMLSKGYIPNEAGYSANKVDSQVPPNEAYITAKEAIPGAVKRGSFEAYKEQNRLALELGEITEEQLYQEWEQGQILAQSQAQFEPQSQAQTQAQPSESKRFTGKLLDNLRENRDAIAEEGILAKMDGSEFAPSGKHIVDQVSDFFASLGNKVTRLGFGDIALTRRGAKNSVSHGMGRNKAIAFSAVPTVIENGIVIDEQTNWKGRGTDSVTFGGRIQIGDKTYDMGVIVHKYGKESPNYGKYYLHEVLLTDEDGATVPIETRTLSGYPSDTVTPSSMDSVAQEQGAVNEENGLPEGMGAASKDFAGDFASWVENTPGDQFHRINESAYQQTEAEQGRAREEIPTMNPYGRLTSKTASTLMNANITPNDFVTKMEDALARGEFSRMVYSDAKATAQVRQKIENVGFQRAKEDWMGAMQNGSPSKFNTAMGITLYNNAVNAGDAIAALDIANTMIDYAKDTAQALQGFNLINKMSPEGQLYSITKTVENLNEKARRRSKVDKETGLPKFEDIELDPELVQRFLDAETQEERDAIRKEIYQDIGRKMPATWQDKFDAFRYTMMLANIRTHGRNVLGNLGFMPVRMMKNTIAATMEGTFNVQDRTKSVLNVASKEDRALFQAGWHDFNNVEELIKNGGKYDEAQSIIRDSQQVFTSPLGKLFQKGSDANSWLLDKEDMAFSRPAYAESLAMYLKANKISAVDYMNDTISQEVKNKAQEYAILEAQKATYRDLNAFSEFVTRSNRLKHSNNAVDRAASYLVEGVLPFKKTPANILVRGVEYSPIGLAKGLTYDLAQVRSGNKTAAEAIDNIAAGLTGTGLLALGGLMFAKGLISAGSTGDDKQDDFNDLRGAQSYALQIGDKSYTLDWLAPEALPFFVGVELKNAYDQLEGLNFFQFLDVLKNVADPMLEMSMLQSLNDTIDNIKFSDNGLGAIVSNVLTNYLTQFLPTLGGQIERTGESTRQSTFYDPNSPLPKSLQKLIGKTLNKVPGLEYNQIDYLDAWGRTEETGTPLQRFFNNFLSPGYSSTWNSSAMEDELQRLYDAGYTDVFPSSVKQSADFMGGKMTADQWSARQKTQGQEAYRILTQFMQTDTYKNMSDDDKARYIETVYDYANGIGKIAAGEPAEKEAKWIQSAQAGKEKVGLDPSAFASVYAYKRTLENDDSTDDEVVKQGMLEDYINGRSDLNDSQKEYLSDSIKFFKMNPVKADSYQKVKNAGYDNPQEIQALLNAKKEFDTNDNGDVSNSELYKGIVGKTSDPVEQEKLYNAYKDKNVTTSWSDFAKTQGAQTAKEEKAQTALNNAVSTEKQASFASSVETNGKDSYVKIYRALMAVDATEAERAAYYDYINSQRGTPWKKDWAHAKQKAIENIAAGK